MEYRMLPHGGEKIGVIGMGSSVVGAQKEADIIKTVRAAFDLGVNYFDMAGPLWRRLYHRRIRLDDRAR